MDCSSSGFSVHRISQAGILEWVTFPFSRGFSQPRDWIWVSHTAGRFLTIWATREAQGLNLYLFYLLYWQVGSSCQHHLGSPANPTHTANHISYQAFTHPSCSVVIFLCLWIRLLNYSSSPHTISSIPNFWVSPRALHFLSGSDKAVPSRSVSFKLTSKFTASMIK